MKENYIPFHINNFDRIQKNLQDRYSNEFQGTELKAVAKDWTRENFLELYDFINEFFNSHNATVVSARFFFTPAGKSLGVHADGEWYEPMYWALNIPVFCSDTGHWQEWFDYHGDLNAIRENSLYTHYILPDDPLKLELVDRLTLTTPHLLRVGTFHRVINQSSEDRLIVSIRFDCNTMGKLLNSIREQQSS